VTRLIVVLTMLAAAAIAALWFVLRGLPADWFEQPVEQRVAALQRRLA
jgi:hypothetical protein